jgi:hypothetical protein
VANFQRFLRDVIERRIGWVNERYDAMKKAWPDGSALEFVLAYELMDSCEFEILDALRDPAFQQRVVAVASERGIPIGGAPAAPAGRPADRDLDESESDDDDECDEPRSKWVRWSAADTQRFIAVLEELREARVSWQTVARRIQGRSASQCRHMYKRLRRANRIDFEFRTSSRAEPQGIRVTHLIGIQFSYKNRLAFACTHGDKLRQVASANPLVNYVDQITAQKIIYPAISPDFYLLDYMTWCKVLTSLPVNPFTNLHMNKRQLKFLSVYNIRKYVDKIVNLEACRPPNPEDDNLAKLLEAAKDMEPIKSSDDDAGID